MGGRGRYEGWIGKQFQWRTDILSSQIYTNFAKSINAAASSPTLAWCPERPSIVRREGRNAAASFPTLAWCPEIAVTIDAVALAMALWIKLSYALGLVGHPDKRVLVRGTASDDEVMSSL